MTNTEPLVYVFYKGIMFSVWNTTIYKIMLIIQLHIIKYVIHLVMLLDGFTPNVVLCHIIQIQTAVVGAETENAYPHSLDSIHVLLQTKSKHSPIYIFEPVSKYEVYVFSLDNWTIVGIATKSILKVSQTCLI